MRLSPLAAACLLAAPLLSVVSACTSSSTTAGRCGAITREALDPGSIQHVLSDAAVQYLTDPPTSGAHQPAPPISGFRSDPITKPVQVGLLEEGKVLIQYHGLAKADAARLRALVSAHVVVAPAASLPHGQHVVATAWLYKRTCGSVDTSALRAFVAARAGHGPT